MTGQGPRVEIAISYGPSSPSVMLWKRLSRGAVLFRLQLHEHPVMLGIQKQVFS